MVKASKAEPTLKKNTELSIADRYLSPNLDKRKGEIFFWGWHVAWILWFFGIVVTGAYETFDAWSYTKTGIIVGIPPIILPLFFPRLSGEQDIPWQDRWTTKSNIFVGIMSFIGNYLWTHYFYVVLGTTYTFPSHFLNNVPIACYLITHSYFTLYHGVASVIIRSFWRSIAHHKKTTRYIMTAGLMCVMGWTTALIEVATISSFPYYSYPDPWRMWVIGSGFYGLYFLFSFPMYTIMDDEPQGPRWSLWQVTIETFAQCMIVTQLLDFWRLAFGNLNDASQLVEAVATGVKKVASEGGEGVPFVY